MLPICFELIDSLTPVLVAQGASGLIHLLDHLDPSSDWFQEYAESALSVLNTAFTSCREGPVVILLGQALIRLMRFLKDASKRRRQTTRQWLSLLHQSSLRPSSETICWELLVGGIIALLHQHSELENADAVEICRLGLSALLPLSMGEFVDTKTEVAALVALINLMTGAHTVMPRHGGKIMSHLLSSATAFTVRDRAANVGPRDLTIHTAAVSLIVCGPKFAGTVLEDVSRNEASYQKALSDAVSEVRQCADNLIAADGSPS
jgi:hypothetical protein